MMTIRHTTFDPRESALPLVAVDNARKILKRADEPAANVVQLLHSFYLRWTPTDVQLDQVWPTLGPGVAFSLSGKPN